MHIISCAFRMLCSVRRLLLSNCVTRNMLISQLVMVVMTILGLSVVLSWKQHNDLQYKRIVQMQHTGKPRGITIDPPGGVLERYEHLSDTVQKVREEVWNQRGKKKSWQDISDDLYIIDPEKPAFFNKLSNLENVRTIYLYFSTEDYWPGWSPTTDNKNLLIQEYHEWAADPEYCEIVMNIEQPAKQRYSWNPYCNSDRSSVIPPSSIHVDLLNPSGIIQSALYHTTMPDFPPVYVTYISIIQDVIITEAGSVLSQDYKIITQPCRNKENILVPKNYWNTPLYNEVLSFAQFWSRNVFHTTIESIQRIIPYLKFLRSNPGVKIHMGDSKTPGRLKFTLKMLELLGIKSDRICDGDIRAKVAYVPEGSHCWFNHVPNNQLLSYTYRQIIRNMAPKQERRSVVFIKRTNRRFILDTEFYENMMETIATRNGLNFEIFTDNPTPPLEESMKLFDRAVLVLAPHGAGFFNMVFCRPGTYIIEIMCPNKVVLSIMRLAHSLGHRYYGHMSQNYRTGDKNDGRECNQGVKLDKDAFEDMFEYFVVNAVKLIENT